MTLPIQPDCHAEKHGPSCRCGDLLDRFAIACATGHQPADAYAYAVGILAKRRQFWDTYRTTISGLPKEDEHS